MFYKKKTCQEKLEDSKGLPKTAKLEPEFPCHRALKEMGAELGDSIVLTRPLKADAIMKKVLKGRLITLKRKDTQSLTRAGDYLLRT